MEKGCKCKYAIVSPPACLTPFIEEIWLQQSDSRFGSEVTTVLPTGRCELIFDFGDGFTHELGIARRRFPRCVVLGPRTEPMKVRANGRVGLIIVCFRPWGGRTLLGDLQTDLQNAVLDFSDLSSTAQASTICDDLRICRTNQYRIHMVTQLLIRGLRVQDNWQFGKDALALINQSWGKRSVGKLAKEFSYSARHFSRLFNRQIGMTPKQMCDIVRVQKAIGCLRMQAPIVAVAKAYGYVDVAHLCRHVKRYSSMTPRSIRMRHTRPLMQHFNKPSLGHIYNTIYL